MSASLGEDRQPQTGQTTHMCVWSDTSSAYFKENPDAKHFKGLQCSPPVHRYKKYPHTTHTSHTPTLHIQHSCPVLYIRKSAHLSVLSRCEVRSNCNVPFLLLAASEISSHFKDFLLHTTILQACRTYLTATPHSYLNCVYLTQTHSRLMHLCTSLHHKGVCSEEHTTGGGWGAALRSTPQGGAALRSAPQGGVGVCSEEHTTGGGGLL